MFDKYMRAIGWKDYYGRWDKEEIKIDVAIMVGIIIVIIAVTYLR